MEKRMAALKQALANAHGRVYGRLNANSTSFLQKHSNRIPLWLSADVVTSGRLALVFPTAILISQDYHLLPAALVLINATFDYVDGAVARWEKEDPARKLALRMNRARFVDVGVVPNKRKAALNNAWGAYYDALADKAFAIPIWCSICAISPDAFWLQAGVLSHVAVESLSAYIRTKSYFSDTDASTVVTANATGKVKQTVSMVGTALALIPATQIVGGILLWASLPLSVASLADKLRDKEVPRVLVCSKNYFRPQILSELEKLKRSREIIACVQDNTVEKEAALSIPEAIDGVTLMKNQQLTELEFDSLGAETVFIASDDDLSLIEEPLVNRGVIKKLM